MSEHILVIKHGAFGDIIQADGALRDIRTAGRNTMGVRLIGLRNEERLQDIARVVD